MIRVTSVELQKQFGRYREVALREPVAVTHHGRDSLVDMSAAEFERLKKLDTRLALHPWELPDDLALALATAEAPASTAQFNDELAT